MATSLQTKVNEMAKDSSSPKVELKGFDFVQLYVGNAYQWMHFLRNIFGFTPIAYCGLETGVRNRVSYVLAQEKIRVVVTSPLDKRDTVVNEIASRGDAVIDVAFTVESAADAFQLAVSRGALPVMLPAVREDEFGKVVVASVRAFGGLVHSFVERSGYIGAFMPGYQSLTAVQAEHPPMAELDHVAISVPEGELDGSVEFYTRVLDLKMTHQEQIVTQNSSMNSRVVQNETGTVRFPMMEPAKGRGKSQIEEFLKYNDGPGVQHLAFSCNDILQAVRKFRNAGAEFLKTPDAYYDLLLERVGLISQDLTELRELNMLVDRDEWGHLLQIFSKPISGRPTLFFELIQRHGARGFGSGNIKALFDAVEREQRMRGNL